MSASTPSSDDEAIAALRREYRYGTLGEADVSADPLTQFQRWFAGKPSRPWCSIITPWRWPLPGGESLRCGPFAKGCGRSRNALVYRSTGREGSGVNGKSSGRVTLSWRELDQPGTYSRSGR